MLLQIVLSRCGGRSLPNVVWVVGTQSAHRAFDDDVMTVRFVGAGAVVWMPTQSLACNHLLTASSLNAKSVGVVMID